jgi:hypothetical protein
VLIKIKRYLKQLQSPINRVNRDPNGVNRGKVLSYPTLFCAENRRNIATLLHITVFRDMAINREPIADFIDSY